MRGESLQKLTQKKAAMEELRKKVIFRKQIKNDKIPFIITWNVLNGLKSLIQRQILIYLKKNMIHLYAVYNRITSDPR